MNVQKDLRNNKSIESSLKKHQIHCLFYYYFSVNTHVHADHVTGTGAIKELVPTCQSVISKDAFAKADVFIEHGDKLKFGKFELEVRSTPGHTNGK